MDLDASEQIVQGIRQRRNLEGGKDFDSGLTSPTGAEATEIPRNVIVLVIGGGKLAIPVVITS